MAERYPDLSQWRRIGTICIGGIGDLIFAIPAIVDLRRAIPEGQLLLVTTQPRAAALLRARGYVDAIVGVPAPGGLGADRVNTVDSIRRWLTFARSTLALRAMRLDATLFLATAPSVRQARWQALIGARFRAGTGVDDVARARWFHTYVAAWSHRIDENQQLLAALGIPTRDPAVGYAEVFAPERRQHKDLGAVIHPFVHSPNQDSRAWALERFAELESALLARGTATLVVGTARELATWPGKGPVRALTTIEDSAALLARARVVIGNDSAVTHLAEAVGTPAVFVHGSTDWRRTGPRLHGEVVRLNLPCSPCFDRRGYSTCPHRRCMGDLPVELVLASPLVRDLGSLRGV